MRSTQSCSQGVWGEGQTLSQRAQDEGGLVPILGNSGGLALSQRAPCLWNLVLSRGLQGGGRVMALSRGMGVYGVYSFLG